MKTTATVTIRYESPIGWQPFQAKPAWTITRLLVLVSAVLVLTATPARATEVHSSAPQLISGMTPLPRKGETDWCGSFLKFQDWERDNSLSVNPANPANLAVAWIQDDSDAIVVGYSTDSGKTWGHALPPTTPCTGGIEDFGTEPGKSAIDPSLSFGPDGMAYLTSIVSGVGGSAPTGGFAAVVNTSADGGRTWSPPRILDTAVFPVDYIDASYVIADPGRPGSAYALWNKGDVGFAARHQYVSSTHDGGDHWTAPVAIPSSLFANGGALLVLPDGMLVDIVAEVPPQSGFVLGELARQLTGVSTPLTVVGPTTLMARRSIDRGLTWLPPIPIAVADAGAATPAVAIAADGTLYAAWQTRLSESTFSLMFSKSNDGGLTWQPPRAAGDVVAGPAARTASGVLLAPSLAVAADGTVGIAFYDHRNSSGGDPLTSTNYWLRYSRDGGPTWQEDLRLGGPFDQTTAPRKDIGDYQGIASIRGGFATSFVMAEPVSAKSTDVYFRPVHFDQRNKVKNPSFEQSDQAGTAPANWTGASGDAGILSWSHEGSDGARSVSVTGNGGSTLLTDSPRWISDAIAVTGGETLTLRVSVSSLDASSASSAGLVYLDSLGQVIRRVTALTTPLDTGGFTTLESAVIVPLGAVEVQVELSAFSSVDQRTAGTVTFDEVGLFNG
jgi:hypothetical protein